jgi:hypothetical protein
MSASASAVATPAVPRSHNPACTAKWPPGRRDRQSRNPAQMVAPETPDRIGREPCSDSATSISGVTPAAPQRVDCREPVSPYRTGAERCRDTLGSWRISGPHATPARACSSLNALLLQSRTGAANGRDSPAPAGRPFRWLAGSLCSRVLTLGSGRGVLRLGEFEAMGWRPVVGAEAEEGALTGALLDGKFGLRER